MRYARQGKCHLEEHLEEHEEDESSTKDGPSSEECHVTEMPNTNHDYCVEPMTTEEQLVAAREEISRLSAENEALKSQQFGIQNFMGNPKLIQFYTGFPDYDTLRAVFLALQPTAQTMASWAQVQRTSGTNQHTLRVGFQAQHLSLFNQFFMFLCRIRLGLLEQDLALRFNVSQSTVSRICVTWANYLYFMLGSLPIWPSRAAVDELMPEYFKSLYPKTRVILDCTEVRVQTASSKVLNSETYSHYKGTTTLKSLVGISPDGSMTFVSSLYTGSISDKEITKSSGILNLLEEGDAVMVDKGFLIKDVLDEIHATVIIPPFLGPSGQFSHEELAHTHNIARLRIHIERAIRRIKEYHIFDRVIPLSLAGSVNQLWTVCGILTNFQGPLF
ncbi:THAP domain-containing 1 [Labeo rohita]|uniref:THAP domain-containing 1 n=1 Tax=Labeo rohita TaxID=84645 RepID=A0A498NE32_LABRO|nr:THAP domain-containing 1 [Labeo rohita]